MKNMLITKPGNQYNGISQTQVHAKKRILFANIPADGHFSPLTSLAVCLKKAGHDVRWYTGPSYVSKIKQLEIPFYLFNKAKEVTVYNIDDVFPGRKAIKNHVKKIIFDICTYFIERGTEFYEDIKDINKSFDFDILVCDSAFTGMSFVKEKLGKHTVVIGILPLCESSKQLPPPIMGLTPSKNHAVKIVYSLLRLLTDKVLFRKPHALIDDQYRRAGMDRHNKNLFDLQIDKSTLFLQSGTPGFEYSRKNMSRQVHFIGPLLPSNNNEQYVMKFKDKLHRYGKVLLVTQGTFESDVNKLIVPAIEAFKHTNKLVIVTTAGWQTDSLRERYKAFDNIVIENFIPFKQVMPFADVFISNGGYGGIMLSIANKLPMVVAGIHEGKNEVCARVGYFKLGINMRTENPKPQKLREALDEVLNNPLYRKNVEKLSEEFARYDAQSLCEKFINGLPAIPKNKTTVSFNPSQHQ